MQQKVLLYEHVEQKKHASYRNHLVTTYFTAPAGRQSVFVLENTGTCVPALLIRVSAYTNTSREDTNNVFIHILQSKMYIRGEHVA